MLDGRKVEWYIGNLEAYTKASAFDLDLGRF